MHSISPREQFRAALECRPPAGRVPKCELEFSLTMEAFGKVHSQHRQYAQWEQRRASERKLHREEIARLYLAVAERYEHSAILLHANPPVLAEHLRLISRVRELSGSRYFLMLHGDATFGIPSGGRMEQFCLELAALNLLAGKVDTSVPQPPADHPAATPFLVWNPHPYLYQGPLELEACLDHRPIAAYAGRPGSLPLEVRGPNRRPMSFQMIATEHALFPSLVWRKRIVVNVKIPHWGWNVFTMGWREGARRPRVADPVKGAGHTVRNGRFRIRARKGARGVDVFLRGRPLCGQGGLQLAAVDDKHGSWGDENETPASAQRNEIKRYWKITDLHLLESGPERCALWVRFSHGRSRADLTFTLARGRAAADVQARIFWSERSARLKLIMSCGGNAAEYDVPSGVVRRASCGEVPGGRWVRVENGGAGFGFASDALYGFNLCQGVLEASIARSSRYADTRTKPASAEPWRPAMDLGELQFRFLLAGGDAPLARQAEFLEQPLPVMPLPAATGSLGRAGSFGRLLPAGLQLLAVKPACDGRGWIIRVREIAGRPARARLVWMGELLALGRVVPYQLTSWRIGGRPGQLSVNPCRLTE